MLLRLADAAARGGLMRRAGFLRVARGLRCSGGGGDAADERCALPRALIAAVRRRAAAAAAVSSSRGGSGLLALMKRSRIFATGHEQGGITKGRGRI